MRGKRARNTENDKNLAPFDFCIIKRPHPDKGRRPFYYIFIFIIAAGTRLRLLWRRKKAGLFRLNKSRRVF